MTNNNRRFEEISHTDNERSKTSSPTRFDRSKDTSEIGSNIPTDKFGTVGKVAEISYQVMRKSEESSLSSQSDQGNRLSDIDPTNLKKSKADGFGGEIQKMLQEWHRLQTHADEIKATEVYGQLSGKIKTLRDSEGEPVSYKDKLEEYETLHADYMSGLKQAKDLQAKIQEFETLNKKMHEVVAFEQKVKMYDLIGMTSEQFSDVEFDYDKNKDEINNIMQRVKNAAARFGWKGVMERATEVIQQMNNLNCMYIIWAIGESKDTSVVSDLVKMLPNEQINEGLRWEIGSALSTLGDESVASDLVKMLPNEQINIIVRRKIIDTLRGWRSWRNNESIVTQLRAIRDNDQVASATRTGIKNLLDLWDL